MRRVLERQREARAPLGGAGEEPAGMVGRTPAMVEVYKTIARVAPGLSTVLILGESGTGKELVARAIHRHSPRRERAVRRRQLRGAHRDAARERAVRPRARARSPAPSHDAPGLFAEADGGTLFLDEIGDITPPLQAKLLRVLQEHEVRPVGGTQWRPVDVRVVAATNRDLAARGQRPARSARISTTA